ncbi:hypothetical protein ASB57_15725 [Bordetella sp. N]|nr:hypothetical protein ASB57_15725 [Bordetella sp. N]
MIAGTGMGSAEAAPGINTNPVVPTPLAPTTRKSDAKRAQVLFADLQPALIKGSRTTPPEQLVLGVGTLAKAAQILALPMTFSLVPEGGRWGRALPALQPYIREDNAFWRTSAGAFMDTPTVDHLHANGRPLLILSGFAAEVVVLHTALGALEAGYEVHVPVDAIGGITTSTQEAALKQIERAGGVTTSIHSIITRIAPDLGAPPGSTALQALRPLRAS